MSNPTWSNGLSYNGNWDQATGGTTDYFVKDSDCMYRLPQALYGNARDAIPSGAFDGVAFVGAIGEVGYNEYVGTCLNNGGLKAGTEYTFTLTHTHTFMLAISTPGHPKDSRSLLLLYFSVEITLNIIIDNTGIIDDANSRRNS
jgi:hypothetical protein